MTTFSKQTTDRSQLSPSYLTSRSSLLFLAKAKQKEALQIAEYMQMDVEEKVDEVFNPAVCMEEFIYLATNALIRRAGNANILEFPCGYSPRGFQLVKEGYNYIGADTSMIVQTMGLTKANLEEKGEFDKEAVFHYTNISLSNYASLAYAASLFKGPITIVTQGVMSWLTMDKKLSMIDNIRTLLAEYGGSWIMADVDSKKLTAEIYKIVKNRKSELDPDYVPKKKTSNKPNKLNIDTVNWTAGIDLAESMKKLGFLAEKVTYPEKLPYLNSLDLFDDGKTRIRTANAMKAYEMMVFTADPDYEEEMDPDKNDFSVFMSVFGTTLQITICGDLNTVNSPILLEKFEQVNKEGGFSEIDIDFSYVPMIDPAGLRALLVMKRAIGDKILRYGDMNDAVAEVMNATGFGDVLD